MDVWAQERALLPFGGPGRGVEVDEFSAGGTYDPVTQLYSYMRFIGFVLRGTTFSIVVELPRVWQLAGPKESVRKASGTGWMVNESPVPVAPADPCPQQGGELEVAMASVAGSVDASFDTRLSTECSCPRTARQLTAGRFDPTSSTYLFGPDHVDSVRYMRVNHSAMGWSGLKRTANPHVAFDRSPT